MHDRPQPSPPSRASKKPRRQRPTVPTQATAHREGAGSSFECCDLSSCSYEARNEFPCCRQPKRRCGAIAPNEPCGLANADPCLQGAVPAPPQRQAVHDDAEAPEPALNGPFPVLVNAAPVDLPGSGTLFCAVFFVAIMFVGAIGAQVYLMHISSHHDSFLAMLDEHEKEDAPLAPQQSAAEQTAHSRETQPTVPWKINPGLGSRPPGSNSRHPRAYWNTKKNALAESDKPLVDKRETTAVPEPPVLREYPLLFPRDYQGERKSICMFHALSAGRTRNGVHYKPWNFPYHLCTHVVYCCVGISADLELVSRHLDVDITEGSIAYFAAMKHKNPYLRVYIAIGGDEKDPAGFARMVGSVGLRQQFAHNAVTWMRRAQYDGMILYWKYPFMEQKARLVDTMRYLRQVLRGVGLTVGIVVPLDEMLRERFNVSELSRTLEDYTILVDPIDTQEPSYDATYVPFRDGTVRMYAGLFMSTLRSAGGDRMKDGRFRLCYLFPINALTFTLEQAAETDINAPTVGPGEPGPSTEVPGFLSYDEVCSEKWESTRRVNYGLVSTRGNQWVVFQNRSSLYELLRALDFVTGPAKCLGVWDPFWDDFAGVCGEGPYPLTRAIFAKVIGRKIPFQKKKNRLNLL
ncbi:hypothetical protein V5799_004767 [Amblyomma americanum]|uniref:GH18 domain-containing protein n=1 Tax=Amblyomma americanum TaxID=6943 RepID=A0AAQ4D561_AMBAM